MESCTNCGHLIGARQKALLIDERVYCEVCHPVILRKLEADRPKPPAPRPPPMVAPGEPGYVQQTGDIICPNVNCKYVGPPKRVAKGSILVLILLALFTLGIAAILYMIFFSGHKIVCPRCGLQLQS